MSKYELLKLRSVEDWAKSLRVLTAQASNTATSEGTKLSLVVMCGTPEMSLVSSSDLYSQM